MTEKNLNIWGIPGNEWMKRVSFVYTHICLLEHFCLNELNCNSWISCAKITHIVPKHFIYKYTEENKS